MVKTEDILLQMKRNPKGKAKVYQIKQVLLAIEKLEDDHVS
ncbi:MAG: hypothetical protein QNL14_10010 [Deltaproteobacteria bacterium]|nr:hypothetical protein [Deltaproteobacteria bacterium]